MLTADPFDAEVQQKIAEEIRLDRVFFGHMFVGLFSEYFESGVVYV